MFGSAPAVTALLQNGADVNRRISDGRTPLHLAAAQFESGLCNLLFANGADVNAVDARGATPLHTALRTKAQRIEIPLIRADVVKALTSAGANCNVVAGDGKTPLALLLNRRCQRALRKFPRGSRIYLYEVSAGCHTLHEHGARMSDVGCDGVTVAHVAALFDDIELLTVYRAHGGDVDAFATGIGTPICVAFGNNANVAMRWLAMNGAHVDVTRSHAGDVLRRLFVLGTIGL